MTDPTATAEEPAAAEDKPEVNAEQPDPDNGDVTEDEDLEQPDVDEDVQFEEPEDAGPQRGISEAQAEKAAKDAEADWKRFAARTLERWGPESANMVECPLCLPQHKGFIDLRFAGKVPQEVVRPIQQYLGIAQEVEYEQDTDTRTCPKCQGYGKTRTGSLVPTQATHMCATCSGYGFVPPPSGAPKPGGNVASAPNGASPVGADAAEDFTHADMDEFQQPRILPDGRENPNYGRRPAYWVQVEPWGATAGLTAQDVA